LNNDVFTIGFEQDAFYRKSVVDFTYVSSLILSRVTYQSFLWRSILFVNAMTSD